MVGFGLSSGRTGDAVAQALENREIGVVAAISVSTAGGVIVADMIANRVLPMVGISADPSTLVDGLASAGLKGVIALAIGIAAAELTGIPQLAAVFLAVGVLTSAGADLLTIFFDLPQLAQIGNGGTVSRSMSSGSTSSSGTSSQRTSVQSAPRRAGSSTGLLGSA